jgi:hypothetical protein
VTQHDLTALIHLAGFATGVVLYTMLAVMTSRRARAGHGADTAGATDRLPLAAGLLGIVWNVGALISYSTRDFGLAEPPTWFTAMAFAALGFLPAVVVDSARRPDARGSAGRVLAFGAYGVSAVAALLQLIDGAGGVVPSRAALVLLTIGYAVILALLAIRRRGEPGWQRALSTAVLAAFAVSALHLSHEVGRADSWIVALVGHHASLPLVLVILYQDHRFAFFDLFLRRALTLVTLVALALALHVFVAEPVTRGLTGPGGERLLATAIHIALWVGTALVYPLIRAGVERFVNGVLLNRVDYLVTRDGFAATVARMDDPDAVFVATREVIATVLDGAVVEPAMLVAPGTDASSAVTLHSARDRAVVHIATSEPPSYALDVRNAAGARRLMSDDVIFLENIASIASRRIDAIRATRERFARDLREQEILQLAAESELKALRAQLNPHFLFNALTTIGYLMRAAPERALGTLYRLTELLRSVLHRPVTELVTLAEELVMVDAYLAIERERFEERLSVTIDVSPDARECRLPALLLQPLVENAVRHGISPLKRGGSVSIVGRIERVPGDERVSAFLRLLVADTGAGIEPFARSRPSGTGVGLNSVERRLERHYGAAATLRITGAPGFGTTVALRIPVTASMASLDAEPRGNPAIA